MPRIKERALSPKQSQRLYRLARTREHRIRDCESALHRLRSSEFAEIARKARPTSSEDERRVIIDGMVRDEEAKLTKLKGTT
jgi:nucleotidyltransferase/DNA polymerase involved in DNA repair